MSKELVQLTEILTGPSEGAVNRELQRMVRRGQVAAASRLTPIPGGKGYAVKVIRIAEPRPRRRWLPVVLAIVGAGSSLAVVVAVVWWVIQAILAALATAGPFLALGLLLLALAGLGGGSVKVVQSVVIKR